MMMIIVLGIIAYVLVAAATFTACLDDGVFNALAIAVFWPCILPIAILFGILVKIVDFAVVLVRNLATFLTRH